MMSSCHCFGHYFDAACIMLLPDALGVLQLVLKLTDYKAGQACKV